jgi:hypothetical protein
MAPELRSDESRSWYAHPLVKLFLTPFIVPVAMGIVSVYMTQARTTDRLGQVEARQASADSRMDANRKETSQTFDEVRHVMVTKELLDEKWKTVEKIEHTTDRLLDLQLQGGARRPHR